jgi:hypothetical protein
MPELRRRARGAAAEDGRVIDFSNEPTVVRALWDEDGARLAVVVDHADRDAIRALGQRLLPRLAERSASLAIGPEHGVMPSARGTVIYER